MSVCAYVSAYVSVFVVRCILVLCVCGQVFLNIHVCSCIHDFTHLCHEYI